MKNWIYIGAAVVAAIFALSGKAKPGKPAPDADNTRKDPDLPPTPIPDLPTDPNPAPPPPATEAQIVDALGAIIRADGSPAIARLVEKVYRLETGNFKSALFRATNAAGMKAVKKSFPFGWAARGTVASDYGPTVRMTDTGEGVAADWVVFRSLPVAMGYLAQYIRDYKGNAARWNGTDPARQAAYTAKLAKIATPFTDAAVAGNVRLT